MFNNISIFGRLFKDPELKRTASGLAICNISVACDRDIKREDKPALFIGATFFGNQADNVAKYFKKGDPIIVTGRLENDLIEDKKHPGEKIAIYYIAANGFSFVRVSNKDKKDAGEQPSARNAGGLEGLEVEAQVDDDLPF